MKKYPLLITLLAGLVISVIISCEKEVIDQEESSTKNSILFEDLSLQENISPNFYDDHLYRVELLCNEDLDKLLDQISGEDIPYELIDLYGTIKCHFNHSNIVMYSIPFRSSDDRIIIYQYKEIFQLVFARFSRLNPQTRSFSIYTPDDRLYYSLELGGNNTFSRIETEENTQMEAFNTRIGKVYEKQHGIEDKASLKAGCCRKESNLRSCIECTTAAFRTTVIGNISLLLFGPETLAAISFSCLNAGPNALC